jgi:hypothetical protein
VVAEKKESISAFLHNAIVEAVPTPIETTMASDGKTTRLIIAAVSCLPLIKPAAEALGNSHWDTEADSSQEKQPTHLRSATALLTKFAMYRKLLCQ